MKNIFELESLNFRSDGLISIASSIVWNNKRNSFTVFIVKQKQNNVNQIYQPRSYLYGYGSFKVIY